MSSFPRYVYAFERPQFGTQALDSNDVCARHGVIDPKKLAFVLKTFRDDQDAAIRPGPLSGRYYTTSILLGLAIADTSLAS